MREVAPLEAPHPGQIHLMAGEVGEVVREIAGHEAGEGDSPERHASHRHERGQEQPADRQGDRRGHHVAARVPWIGVMAAMQHEHQPFARVRRRPEVKDEPVHGVFEQRPTEHRDQRGRNGRARRRMAGAVDRSPGDERHPDGQDQAWTREAQPLQGVAIEQADGGMWN